MKKAIVFMIPKVFVAGAVNGDQKKWVNTVMNADIN